MRNLSKVFTAVLWLGVTLTPKEVLNTLPFHPMQTHHTRFIQCAYIDFKLVKLFVLKAVNLCSMIGMM